MQKYINHRLFLLYLASFVTILGFSLVFPLLPYYAQTFGATPSQIGLLAASFSITQFIAAPILGRVSDRIGRKPILAFALGGSSLAFLLFGYAKSLEMLFISRALHGFFSAGAFPIAIAYIADITTKEERLKYISRLTATFAVAFIIGPAFSGFLSQFSINLPFYIASVVAFINLIFILRFLPESLTQKAEKLIIREGFVNIKAIIYGLKGESGAFFFILFGWAFAISNLQVAFPLFSEKAFNFTSVENGYMFAYLGAVNATTQWFFVNKMTRLFGELKTVAMGVLFMATGQFLIPFSPVLGILLLVYSISSVGSSLFRPTTSAIISKRTKEGQGTTMGLAFSFESLGRIAGPLSAGVLIAIFGTKIQFILTSLVLYLGFIYLLISFREPITQFKADSSQN